MTTIQKKRFILYVDDDEDDLMFLKEMMERLYPNIELITFQSGKTMIASIIKLSEGKALPSTIVLDLNMPGWDGIKTLSALKASDSLRSIPAIILTNSDHTGHRRNAFAQGAVEFLIKPSTQAGLIQICHSIASHVV